MILRTNTMDILRKYRPYTIRDIEDIKTSQVCCRTRFSLYVCRIVSRKTCTDNTVSWTAVNKHKHTISDSFNVCFLLLDYYVVFQKVRTLLNNQIVYLMNRFGAQDGRYQIMEEKQYHCSMTQNPKNVVQKNLNNAFFLTASKPKNLNCYDRLVATFLT